MNFNTKEFIETRTCLMATKQKKKIHLILGIERIQTEIRVKEIINARQKILKY